MRRHKQRTESRAGQTLLFFLMAMVILVFVVMWNFDVHKILRLKNITQNAGDASALMAARWQGITLNLIGDLNIMQAVALTANDQAAAASINQMQARLAYVGPMIAFMASQEAAKNNGVFRNPGYDALLHRHADEVRNIYPIQIDPSGSPLFPEPFPGCWAEYADMLDLVADEGIAAGPENARFYTDGVGGHYLLMRDFYNAVAGRIWCWFYNNAPNLLEDYDGYDWWPPLPDIPNQRYVNSEIFGLGLEPRTVRLDSLVDVNALATLASDDRGITAPILNITNDATWYCYNQESWAPWTVMDPDTFPIVGPVKDQYDYIGADAAVIIEASTQRLTPGTGGTTVSNTITWTAAAKPFGVLNDSDRPNSYGLVIPAFHEVRLIPIDAATAPTGGGFSLEWRTHIEQHLGPYLANGGTQSGCWFCQQLGTWEPPAFRQAGIDWLDEFSDRCNTGGGGGRAGGGTRRGH